MANYDHLPEGIENIKIVSETGADVKETRFISKVAASEARYARNMLAGSDLMKFVADMATDISLRRDADSSKLANINVNFHQSVFGGETLEVVGWPIKEGSRSRVYGIAIYKLVSYHADHWDRMKDVGECYHVLEEPMLCVSGTFTVVIRKPRT